MEFLKFEFNLALMYTPSFKSLKISAIINIKKIERVKQYFMQQRICKGLIYKQLYYKIHMQLKNVTTYETNTGH